MDKTTKKFNKAVAALTKELAAPAPDAGKVNKILGKLRKHLTAGADLVSLDYHLLRAAWADNYETLPADTAEELRDIAFTVSNGLTEGSLRNLEAESAGLTRDEELLDCNYDLLIDLTCECYESEGNEECTAWSNVFTPEQCERFKKLKAPESGQALEDWETLMKAIEGWNRRGAVSRKFEILE